MAFRKSSHHFCYFLIPPPIRTHQLPNTGGGRHKRQKTSSFFSFRNWETSTLKCLSIFRVKGVPPPQSQSHLLDIGRREPLLSHPLDSIFSEFPSLLFPIFGEGRQKKRGGKKVVYFPFSPFGGSQKGRKEWGPSGRVCGFFWLLTHRPCYCILLSSCSVLAAKVGFDKFIALKRGGSKVVVVSPKGDGQKIG